MTHEYQIEVDSFPSERYRLQNIEGGIELYRKWKWTRLILPVIIAIGLGFMIYFRDSMDEGMDGVYAISIMFILALLSVFVKEHIVIRNEGVTGGYWIPLGKFIGYEMMHNSLTWEEVVQIGIKHGDVDPNEIRRRAVFIEGKDKKIFIAAYASVEEKEWILNFILKFRESLEKNQKDL